jgi:putative membrane protein
MRFAGKPMADGTMKNEAMFQENCKADVFATAAVDTGAPLDGATSFSDGQASDRISAAGMMTPAGLAKDDKGIWRGTAKKDGKSVSVAVDFKGTLSPNKF